MLSEDLRAQLLQQIQNEEDLTEEEIVALLNSDNGEDDFVRRSTLDVEESVTSFFQRFDRNDIVRNRRQIVTQGLWSEGVGRLDYDSMFTLQGQRDSENGKYFFEVYDKDPNIDLEAARIQFAVAYGNEDGGGSEEIDTGNVEALESTAGVYAQHKNVLFDVNETRDSFFDSEGGTLDSGGSGTVEFTKSEDLYVINISRAQYKQKVDPGNWELRLLFSDGTPSGFDGPDGRDYPEFSSNSQYSVLTLVDETADTDFNNQQLNAGNIGNRYEVYQGSLNLDNPQTSNPDVIQPEDYAELSEYLPAKPYGEFYPDLGIIVLDPNILQRHAAVFGGQGPDRNFNSSTGQYEGFTNLVTFSDDSTNYNIITGPSDISGATSGEIQDIESIVDSIRPVTDKDDNYKNQEKLFNAVKNGGYFVGRSAEEIVSTNYFVRVRNTDFNFSNNPTFTNEDGTLAIEEFEGDPKTFITTVGLYDDDNNLVATAKLSNPVQKDFQSEQLIKIKLDYVLVMFIAKWVMFALML